jgi:hypothetical protein
MFCLMIKSIQRTMDNEAIAFRLRVLRHHVAGSDHGSQARFAAQIGVEYRRWNNNECAHNLSRDMAMQLVRLFHGLTLDWIYMGREDGLSTRLHRDLREAEKAIMLLEGDSSGSSDSSTSSDLSKKSKTSLR